MSLLEDALRFAASAHEGMTRKGGDTPFILHPMEVAAIAATISTDPEILAAALLHDVVEDTPHTLEELEALFGPRVAALVAGDTENKRSHLPAEATWRRRKEETIRYLRTEAGEDAKLIVLGDKLSNLRSLYRDYLSSGEAVWARFHQKDPAQHCWYYYEIGLTLDCFRSCPVMQEYWYLFHQLWQSHPVPADFLSATDLQRVLPQQAAQSFSRGVIL